MEVYAGYGYTVLNEKHLNTQISIQEGIDYVKSSKYYSGNYAGLRLGYTNFGLAAGLDLSKGFLDRFIDDQKDSSKDGQINSLNSTTMWGLFASYKLPLLFRIYGVFMPPNISSLNINKVTFLSDDGETTLECTDSWGLKAGLSYLSIPFFSINFEYQPLYISGEKCPTILAHGLIAYVNLIF